MEQLFTALTHAVEGTPAIALGAALVWGILSILLSPCHLSSIPLIVGFINGQGVSTARRAFAISSLFATGILITIAGIGAITAAAGRMMGDVSGYQNYVVAAIFFVVGLVLLDVISLPSASERLQGRTWLRVGLALFLCPGPVVGAASILYRHGSGAVSLAALWTMVAGAIVSATGLAILMLMLWPTPTSWTRKGALAAFILGLVFGIALGPCTFAYMAPMLGVTFKLAATNIGYGILLLAVYGVGHCSVIVVAGTSTELVQRYLDWNEESKGAVILKKVCGALVLLAGVYLIYIAK
jgi:cytochrome c-type biogenesis protein